MKSIILNLRRAANLIAYASLIGLAAIFQKLGAAFEAPLLIFESLIKEAEAKRDHGSAAFYEKCGRVFATIWLIVWAVAVIWLLDQLGLVNHEEDY